MKSSDFKKIIKEAVKEALREELVASLVSVLKETQLSSHSSTLVKENTSFPKVDISSKYPKPDFSEFLMRTTQDIPSHDIGYNPPPVNTMGDGSSLPQGEVSINQIMGLMSK
jgi:hypothetical protein